MNKERERRYSVSLSMTKNEKDTLMEVARAYGLSLSAYMRMAAYEYDELHGRKIDSLQQSTEHRTEN